MALLGEVAKQTLVREGKAHLVGAAIGAGTGYYSGRDMESTLIGAGVGAVGVGTATRKVVTGHFTGMSSPWVDEVLSTGGGAIAGGLAGNYLGDRYGESGDSGRKGAIAGALAGGIGIGSVARKLRTGFWTGAKNPVTQEVKNAANFKAAHGMW